MIYSYVIHPKCKKEINKACSKNPVLRTIIKKKIQGIILNPSHYKPLMHDLAGERRVHIMKSFVLKFEVNENRKVVTFLAFTHHDDAYKR